MMTGPARRNLGPPRSRRVQLADCVAVAETPLGIPGTEVIATATPSHQAVALARAGVTYTQSAALPGRPSARCFESVDNTDIDNTPCGVSGNGVLSTSTLSTPAKTTNDGGRT